MPSLPPAAGVYRNLLLFTDRRLYHAIGEQQTANLDPFLILAGDFNHADVKTVYPKLCWFSNKGKEHIGLGTL